MKGSKSAAWSRSSFTLGQGVKNEHGAVLLRDNWWGEPRVNEGVGEELLDYHIVTGDLPGSFAYNGLDYITIL